MTIQRIEWLDRIIEQTKKIAKIGDSPIAYFYGIDGNVTLTLLALSEKYQQKMALWTTMQVTQATKIITINEAWIVNSKDPKDLKIAPSENPKKTSCFVISYFSPEQSLSHILNYENVNRKIKWTDEQEYWKQILRFETTMNPYKFTQEEIKEWSELFNIDTFKESTKPEIIKLIYDHELRIYKKDGKAYFEATHHDRIFFRTKIVNDDEEFNRCIEEIKEGINLLYDMFKKNYGDE